MTFMHMDATIAAAAVGNIVGFEWEHGFEVFSREWINPGFVGNIDQYFFRNIDITTWTDGSFPGTSVTYAGVWNLGRGDWRSFAAVSPHGNCTSDVTAEWECHATGAYGSSYSEESIGLTLEIGKLVGITETFEFTNVDIGNDEIVLVGHGFETGDQVVYSQGGGSVPTPLVDQAMYSVRKISTDRISLGTALWQVDATPSFINLTFQGTGTGHTFRRIDAVASVNLDMDSSV